MYLPPHPWKNVMGSGVGTDGSFSCSAWPADVASDALCSLGHTRQGQQWLFQWTFLTGLGHVEGHGSRRRPTGRMLAAFLVFLRKTLQIRFVDLRCFFVVWLSLEFALHVWHLLFLPFFWWGLFDDYIVFSNFLHPFSVVKAIVHILYLEIFSNAKKTKRHRVCTARCRQSPCGRGERPRAPGTLRAAGAFHGAHVEIRPLRKGRRGWVQSKVFFRGGLGFRVGKQLDLIGLICKLVDSGMVCQVGNTQRWL